MDKKTTNSVAIAGGIVLMLAMASVVGVVVCCGGGLMFQRSAKTQMMEQQAAEQDAKNRIMKAKIDRFNADQAERQRDPEAVAEARAMVDRAVKDAKRRLDEHERSIDSR